MPPTGVLLVNLGTPDAPRTPDVRRYLREFLSDPRVIDLPAWLRWPFLSLVILPFRPARSAEAYRKIWTEAGSPLLVNSEALRREVSARLGPELPVLLAMRYGKPSIPEAMENLHRLGVDRLVVFTLYPQATSSSTGTALEKVYCEAGRFWNVPHLVTVPVFFDHPLYIEALATVSRPVLERERPDHVVLSYHGLPERHVRKSDPTGRHCLVQSNCCDVLGDANRGCYRAQCFATSRALARALSLSPDRYTVSFQSRLGRMPWIRPYTDLVLGELPKRGAKRVVVFSPSFVADCVETLEELGIRGRGTFLAAGGQAFALVPCLNAHPAWVEAAMMLIRDALAGDRRESPAESRPTSPAEPRPPSPYPPEPRHE